MNLFLRGALAAIVTFSQVAPNMLAQQNQKPIETDDVIRTTADEVVFDVVVRDKKGKAINTLKAENFEVIDNGQKQQIKGFRLVEGREVIEASKGAAKTKLDPLKQIRLVTLAFSSMGQAEQRVARDSAMQLIKGDQSDNTFYSVVGIYQRLSMLQPYTNDKKLLAAAILKATNGEYQAFLSQGQAIRDQLQNRMRGGGTAPAAPQAGGAAGAVDGAAMGAAMGGAAVENRVNQIMLDMIRYDESLPEAENARTIMYSLDSLVRGMSSMPGRKAIMYFSWGMWFPPQMDKAFRDMKAAANRGNVSFYGVDCRGVQTWGQNQQAKNELAGAVADTASDISRDGGATSKGQIMAADRAETASRSNVQIRLQELSEDTGGFLIGETNDPSKLLKQVNEEINTFYEIAYSPGISNFDGSFRKTTVELKGPEVKGLLAHSRNGYYALPPELQAKMPTDPAQEALLSALNNPKPPTDVEFRAGSFTMTPGTDKSSGVVIAEIPLSGMTFAEQTPQPGAPAAVGKSYKASMSILTLIKDASGQVVEKFSNNQAFPTKAEQLQGTKTATFVQRNNFSLPAGKYTVETAILDRESLKAGVKKTELLVASRPNGIMLSSLAMIKNIQPQAKDLQNEVFQIDGTKISPAVVPTIYATKNATLGIFFIVYPDKALGGKPTLKLEFLKDGNMLQEAPLPVPEADSTGKIPNVFRIPAEAIPPGTYDIRITAKQGATEMAQKIAVTVAPPQTQ
jgi:VWFA-related protein